MIKNMRGFMAGCLACCLLMLGGIGGTPVSAQTPIVPSDRLGWTQSADQIDLFTFAIVVDWQRSALAGHSCAPSNGAFECEAPLPALTPGVHEIRLIAVRTEDGVAAESAPSEPLTINVVVVSSPSGLRIVRG